jgi:hypothetical protein
MYTHIQYVKVTEIGGEDAGRRRDSISTSLLRVKHLLANFVI